MGFKVPLKIQHYCTYKCNFRCKYCNLYNQKSKELSTEEIKNLIFNFNKAGAVSWTFTGGEPLLRKDMEKLVKYAKYCGLHVAMTTNGSLVKNNISWLNKIDLLNISLDGMEKIHDKLRGKGTFNMAMEAIKLLKKNKINVSITVVINKLTMKDNARELKNLLDLINNMGIKAIFMPIYKDPFNKNKVDSLCLSDNDLKKSMIILKKYSKKYPHRLIMSKSAMNWYSKNKKTMKCYAGKHFCSILPNGRVIPCLFKENVKKEGTSLQQFYKLDKIKKCGCFLNCYVEYNHLLAFKLKSLYEFIFQYRKK